MFIRLCIALNYYLGDEIYLRKAKAIADRLTTVQHADGYFPTWMRYKPAAGPDQPRQVDYSDLWPNCMSFSADMLMKLDAYLSGRRDPSQFR